MYFHAFFFLHIFITSLNYPHHFFILISPFKKGISFINIYLQEMLEMNLVGEKLTYKMLFNTRSIHCLTPTPFNLKNVYRDKLRVIYNAKIYSLMVKLSLFMT